MIKTCIASTIFLLAVTSAASAQQVTSAASGELRVLDKLTGSITEVALRSGETAQVGYLTITLNDCRYPTANPSGDAYADVVVRYREDAEPVFAGWMLASAPALSAMDHPRYDVWPLRCITS